MPLCFVQDGWFGSDYNRTSEMPNVYRGVPPGCERSAGLGGCKAAAMQGGMGGAVAAASTEAPVSGMPRRIHTPVYPVCVEHFFSPTLPFSALSFLEARVRTITDSTHGIVARTLSIHVPPGLASVKFESFYSTVNPGWRDVYHALPHLPWPEFDSIGGGGELVWLALIAQVFCAPSRLASLPTSVHASCM